MGQQFKPTRSETAKIKRYARQCEANLIAAAASRAHNFNGIAQTCAFVATDYAEKAMRLAETVAARGAA